MTITIYSIYHSLLHRNHLSLFAEQISLRGEPLDNFPQAFIHLGLISAAFSLTAIETADPVALRNILLYHVVAGSAVFSTDLAAGEVATAMAISQSI